VFDSRFGFSLSDNNKVATWTNRVGSNDATQGTSANRPTYKTTGGSGGQPSILFNSAGGEFLIHGVSITVAPSLFLCVAKRTGDNTSSYPVIAGFMQPLTHNFSVIYAKFASANWGFAPGDSGQSLLDQWRIITAQPLSTDTSSSTTEMWTDGGNLTSSTGGRFGGNLQDRRAIGSSLTTGLDFFEGSIQLVVAIPQTISAALRKRLERAAAYSFKIPCN
jgi:hypothetical protein